jgi:hypothetical protein
MHGGHECRDDEDNDAPLDTSEAPASSANGAELPNIPVRQRQSKAKPSAHERQLPVCSSFATIH